MPPAGQFREVRFEGFDFPVWAVLDTSIPGGTVATASHLLVAGDGERDLPLFRSEEYARAYIGRRKLDRCRPAPVETPEALMAILETLIAGGPSCVRFDDVYGPTPGTITYPAAGLLAFVRDQPPDA